jgi:thiol-disulfide isomerase/thioredoxin
LKASSFLSRPFLFALFGSVLLFGALDASAQNKNGDKIPVYIKLRGVDGKVHDVTGSRGIVTLVSFGATWCLPCGAEIKALEQLKTEYAGKPVQFVWISIDRKEQLSDDGLHAFIKRNKMSLTVLRDPTQLTYAQFSNRVRVPLVVLFGSDGNLAPRRHFGMSTDSSEYLGLMRAEINKLLSEPGASTTAARKTD